MTSYSARQVREILGLPGPLLERLVEARFVSPERGPRRELRFSFQDLVVLRAAKGLADARIPMRRISRSLKRLRGQLPEDLPSRGLRIAAVGDSVAVMEGRSWRSPDGQYLMAFEVAAPQGELVIIEKKPAPDRKSADDWFEQACELERTDAAGAIACYRKAIAANPAHSMSYANLGRLLHARGELAQSESVYKHGTKQCPGDALLAFNFAVLLEERGEINRAIELYAKALASDPKFADAHYNLGNLYDRMGMSRDALRHLNAYRKLRKS